MDITVYEILTTLFGGTSLITLIEVIRYRKQDKRQREADTKIKEREADNSATNTQSRQIDLASKYYENMLSMMERMQGLKESQEKGNDNQSRMLEMLDNIDRRTDGLSVKVGDIEAYLNGNYHSWLADKSRRKNSKNSKNQQNEEID